jgi:outer membrane protein assembly factor BamB
MTRRRRAVLRALGAAGVGLTAGCLGLGGGDSTPQSAGGGGGGTGNTATDAPGTETTGTESATESTTTPTMTRTGRWGMVQGDPRQTGQADAGPPRETVRWEVDLGGKIRSGPVVAGGRLFTTANKRLFAVSLDDGATLWRADLGGQATNTAAYYDGRVFVPTENGVVAVDARSGSRQWTRTLKKGVVSDVTVTAGTVLVTGGKQVYYGLNAADGSVRWDSVPFNFGGLQTLSADGRRVYGGGENAFFAMQDGARQWTKELGGGIVGAPTVGDKYVFVGTNAATALAVEKDTGNTEWETRLNSGTTASPALGSRSLYVPAGGTLQKLQRGSGDKVWETGLDNTCVVGPVLTPEALYLATTSGTIYAISTDNGTVFWKHEAEMTIQSDPALAGGRLYVGADSGQLFAFE